MHLSCLFLFILPYHRKLLCICYENIGNQFSGRLPEKLFQITTLETIALSVNCFSGHLPETLCDAPHVSVMSLDGLGN